MPEFANPFSGVIPGRKLTPEELIRAIRVNIAAEHEAVHLYMAHAEATDHPLAREVLIDVANEEREHIGEFMRLLEVLTGDEEIWLARGRDEVRAMESRILGAQEAAADRGDAKATREGLTVGSLKKDEGSGDGEPISGS